MAFDDILQKIAGDGAEAVAAVNAETADATSRILDGAEREAKALHNQLLRRARQRATERGDRLVTLAHLEHRKALLAEKQRALAEAFDAAAVRVAGASKPELWKLFLRVIADRVETGREEIVPGRDHAELFDGAFMADLNGALGDRGGLTVAAEPGDFAHGLVLREGRKEINLRLSVLMEEARERLVHEMAQHLFPTDAPADG